MSCHSTHPQVVIFAIELPIVLAIGLPIELPIGLPIGLRSIWPMLNVKMLFGLGENQGGGWGGGQGPRPDPFGFRPFRPGLGGKGGVGGGWRGGQNFDILTFVNTFPIIAVAPKQLQNKYGELFISVYSVRF